MPNAIFSLTGLLPLFPFAAFLLIVLWANPHKKLSAGLAIGGIGLSWVLGWAIAFTTFGVQDFGGQPFRLATPWLPTGRTWQAFGFALDPLTAAMLIMVPFVCFLIFVYAYGYMGVGKPDNPEDERGKPATPGFVDPLASRFFAYIALFATGMLGLVISDNLIMLLIFWEIMGLCSYLLIGFWFARKYPNPRQITPKEAGLKAFLTTRVGDTVMLAGILLLLHPDRLAELCRHLQAGQAAEAGQRHRQPAAGGRHPLGHGDRDPDLLRRHGQERAVPAARLAARCHGRPHPRLGADPRRHHGVGRHLPGHPHLSAHAGHPRRRRAGTSFPSSAPSRRCSRRPSPWPRTTSRRSWRSRRSPSSATCSPPWASAPTWQPSSTC